MTHPYAEGRFPYAEDVDGVWHRRADDFWDDDLTAKVRAHALCGSDIWSCHVSEYDPRTDEPDVPFCASCSSIRPVYLPDLSLVRRVVAARHTSTQEPKRSPA